MNTLNNIMNELNSHIGRDRDTLWEEYVKERLNKSLTTYYDSLIKSADYLAERKNKLKVMKNINKD